MSTDLICDVARMTLGPDFDGEQEWLTGSAPSSDDCDSEALDLQQLAVRVLKAFHETTAESADSSSRWLINTKQCSQTIRTFLDFNGPDRLEESIPSPDEEEEIQKATVGMMMNYMVREEAREEAHEKAREEERKIAIEELNKLAADGLAQVIAMSENAKKRAALAQENADSESEPAASTVYASGTWFDRYRRLSHLSLPLTQASPESTVTDATESTLETDDVFAGKEIPALAI
ncbi:hypothetical protein FB45DRAFT_860154 [Roridomyces roridus]|uniref:Uncharacterized protein n=1 Tax=Roridomyces roridus TaxID=1738132 RepID=A0AAD7CDZ2_9AGAR|nr:hypothetical protein FB45DRAFT_860154 [Roridomyces roridus]